ncbi:MAG TPA: hypothetical protein VNJ08_16045 [Bacteriovoracaceae bacterium]|nr:hypothetical protein [Bacteriovoracaceae bacterium]
MKFILFFSLVIGASAFAADRVNLEVQEQAEVLSLALAENEMAPVGTAWHWDVIRVRAMLELGIEIPLISKLSINPEIEFQFVKK